VAPWLLVISPKRSQAAKLQTQLTAAQSQLASIRSQAAANEAARQAFASNYTTLAKLGEAVPADDDVPSLIYQLQGAAGHDHVDFLGLQTAGTGGSTTPSPAPSSSSSSSSSGSSSSSSSSSSPSSTASSSASSQAASTPPPNASAGLNGFDNDSFTFTFQGSFFDLTNFVKRVQRFVVATDKKVAVSGRLLTLNALNLAQGSKGFPQIEATISATSYIAPKASNLPVSHPAGTPAAPGSQSSTTPGSSSAPAPTAAVSSPIK
jgi:hypothetical protein